MLHRSYIQHLRLRSSCGIRLFSTHGGKDPRLDCLSFHMHIFFVLTYYQNRIQPRFEILTHWTLEPTVVKVLWYCALSCLPSFGMHRTSDSIYVTSSHISFTCRCWLCCHFGSGFGFRRRQHSLQTKPRWIRHHCPTQRWELGESGSFKWETTREFGRLVVEVGCRCEGIDS